MHRKQFLIYATTATGLLPLLLTEVACDTYGDAGDGGSDGGETNDDLSFTLVSSSNSNHTHFVTILFADVNAPPAAGKTLTTTGPSHTHTLTLTQTHFQDLADGQTLTRPTTTNSGHSHNFTIKVPETANDDGGGNNDDNPY
ncbi:MAG: hypothetical protein V3U35_05085 [Candidatus Neomarinimicrobiota bacterium]